MSYNLLLDTGFNNINNRWKLVNCTYENGYLIANNKVFSIEQDIVLPNQTKVYFSIDCISFDKNIKSVYVGIQLGDVLESTVKTPKHGKRTRLSVVEDVKQSNIKVKVIVESSIENSNLYIDSPMLIDLNSHKLNLWSKSILDKVLYYKYGFDYVNAYKNCELTVTNTDIEQSDLKFVKGKVGAVTSVFGEHVIDIQFDGITNHMYLIKLDYLCVNDYGVISMLYDQTVSETLDNNQQFMLFRYDGKHNVKIILQNNEALPYIVNLKHLLIVDVSKTNIEIDDIKHIPYVED